MIKGYVHHPSLTKHVFFLQTVEKLLAYIQMNKRPGLNALSMFDAAARHLNFRKASEELNITQGAVAQQVRKLEASLGVDLFIRNARGLELTKTGETYHSSILKALDLIDKATAQVVQQHDIIRISVTPSIASKWLVPLLPEFSQDHPGIAVEIIASETITRFDKQGVDLAIRQSGKPTDIDLEIKLLAPVELHAVCAPDSFVSKSGAPFQLCDFRTMALIQDGHRYWEKLFHDADLTISNPYLQFNQTALAMDAAQNGQGIALVPSILAIPSLKRRELCSLWESDFFKEQQGFYIVYPKKEKETPAFKAFVNWLTGQTDVFLT